MKSLLIVLMACTLQAMAHAPVKTGLWQTLTYDAPDKTPVVFGGWSRAEDVKAGLEGKIAELEGKIADVGPFIER